MKAIKQLIPNCFSLSNTKVQVILVVQEAQRMTIGPIIHIKGVIYRENYNRGYFSLLKRNLKAKLKMLFRVV